MACAIKQFNEGTSGEIIFTFRDKNGNLEAPASARYRIDCKTTGTAVRAWTAIAGPISVQPVTISSSDTAIITVTNEVELKVVTIEGINGADDNVSHETIYEVKNLSYYP